MKFYIHSPEPLEPASTTPSQGMRVFLSHGRLLVVPDSWCIPEGEWQPYADGTSGQQGEASAATEPYRASKLKPTLKMVADSGHHGLTVIELRDSTGWHHGQASGALSNLQRTNQIARLKDRRNRAGIYVTPNMILGRETVPHRSNRRHGEAG